MSIEQNRQSQGKILENIQLEFSKFRDKVGGHYTERLRSQAIFAYRVGISRQQVARAAGVTPKSISNWSKAFPKAKRLNLIGATTTNGPVLKQSIVQPTTKVSIRLTSGVKIDLFESLSLELLEILNKVGGQK